MSTPVDIQPGTLPYDCYPPLPQTLNEDIINAAVATLDQDFPGIVVGADEPAPEYQDRVWFRTTDLQWYYFVNGNWVRTYPVPPSGDERRLWVGIEADLQTYDGGSPGVVGSATGPFWEVDHNFDARFPLGPGNLPSGTTVNVDDTGGEEKHALLEAELAAHYHPLTYNNDSDSGTGGCEQNYNTLMGGEVDGSLFITQGISCSATVAAATVGSGTAHNNMPPYRGVFIIKRTARVYILA